METIKAAWVAFWNAQTTRAGAFFHVFALFAMTMAIVTVQMRMEIVDVDSYLYRLVWIVGATGWALRMIYLADREPDGSRQMWLGRRSAVLIASLMAAGVLMASI